MGYELRQRLTGPFDSWIATDHVSGREVLAHRMGDPASSDLLPLVMRLLLGKNEGARATVLDFVEQDGAWLLVTVDSPDHREIREWLHATGERQADPPAVDPAMITRMFRAADSATPPPAPPDQPETYTQLFSTAAPEVGGAVGEFTRLFVADPGEPNPLASQEEGERTTVCSTAESITSTAPPPAAPAHEPPEQPVAERGAEGDFTKHFGGDPGGSPSPQPRAEELTRQFATDHLAAPSPENRIGDFTQYFGGDPGGSPSPQPRAEGLRAKPQQGEYTRMFDSGGPPSAGQAPDSTASLTAMFGAGASQPPPAASRTANGFFEAPPSKSASPPASAVAGDFTRILQSVPAEPAPEMKVPGGVKPKPQDRVSPMTLVFGAVALLAAILVLTVVLLK